MKLPLPFSKRISSLRIILLSIIPVIWLILVTILYLRNSQHSVLESAPKISFDSGEVILREEWKRIYLNHEPVGYSKVLLQEGLFASKRVYVLNNETNLYLLVAGTNQDVKLIGNTSLAQDLTLLQFSQELYTGGQRLHVRGIFGGKNLKLWIASGAGETERIVPLSQRCYSTEAINLILLRDKFPIGKKYRLPIFDPTTLTADELEVETVGKDSVAIKGEKLPAYEIQERFKGLTQTVWVNPKGEILKEEATLAGLHLVSIKEPKPNKSELQIVRRSTQDLLLTSSIPANREIANPRKTDELTVRLNNVPEQQIEQIKQTGLFYVKETAKNRITLQIKAIDLAHPCLNSRFRGNDVILRGNDVILRGNDVIPAEAGIAGAVNTKQFIKYLAPSALVQSTDQNMVKMAKKIVGNEPDSVRASVKLTQWVYRSVKKKILVSVPSAVDVLKYREGDCNEHSVLFAALARSVLFNHRRHRIH
ncbi:MAG: transglutaminase-like domain-containing protein [bacterium]|nr:transglutaminase-like domain-containing protein [bacterium]